ncbi:MAG: NADH-quinone oxidoreductase subunit F [Nanoarchaeota archaeon]|nr:NADH-quinone oxidoreductase subunit F [Nanoarchaeota archaeon]
MNILTKTNFGSLKKAKELSSDMVIEKVHESGLTGRGGASFPTGLKWKFVAKEKAEPVLICNFDEGEPGTFKDKFILENNVDLLIEGLAIFAYALKASKVYIYFRAEYYSLVKKIEDAIVRARPFIGSLEIEIIHGAGAYICGEETSIINSIEGRAGHPRQKPPYPAQKGLWERPTCVNNVETLANLPLLFLDNWDNSLRLISVSGDVEKPGVFEEKEGVTLGDLMEKAVPKEKPKAIFFGASGGVIPYDPETRLNNEEMKKLGAGLGSYTIIVVGESRNIVDICNNINAFFVHECCGKCTPCREGNYRMHQLLEKMAAGNGTKEDLALVEEMGEFIKNDSFCAMGQSSCNHIITAIKYFKADFEKKCK